MGGHTLIWPTYGSSPRPPPPPRLRNKDNMCGFSDDFEFFFVNLVKHKQFLKKLGKKPQLRQIYNCNRPQNLKHAK